MRTTTAIPTEMKVLMNHIYELHKGVRHMVLFTCNKRYSELAIQRLESQGLPYLLQPAGQQNLNVYFGRRECLEAIRLIVTRPLNQLTPEEDFILGAMLGYDLCAQCERYCKRKDSASREQSQDAWALPRRSLFSPDRAKTDVKASATGNVRGNASTEINNFF